MLEVTEDISAFEKTENPYTGQVEKDVERSLWKLVQGDTARLKKRKQLSLLVNSILAKHPEVHYYQGYHSVAAIVLLVCGQKRAAPILDRLSCFHHRDSMNSNMDVVSELLGSVFNLMEKVDSQVHKFLVKSGVPPFFCLSWFLTWFAHNVDSLPIVSRLFDFFIVSHPDAPLYMAFVITLSRKDELLKVPCDAAQVHKFLSTLPTDINWEELIETTGHYLVSHPPHTLPTPKNRNMPPFPFAYQEPLPQELGQPDWVAAGAVLALSVIGLGVTYLLWKQYQRGRW